MENLLIEGRVNSFLIGLSLSLCVCGLPFPQISHYVIFLSFKETLHQSSMWWFLMNIEYDRIKNIHILSKIADARPARDREAPYRITLLS